MRDKSKANPLIRKTRKNGGFGSRSKGAEKTEKIRRNFHQKPGALDFTKPKAIAEKAENKAFS
ncbi:MULTISPECIES: hypothetical protein [unclassified Lysobacter]|uniref:hypothetical protein n=1 Tax=unclassified Lysobacter TaxID=2635362 RepID=UPI001BE8A08D|nr:MULTISPECIES: hypothetical protein [unclassified Lysobacter]MBT2748649.1 hypothetical protein [Lysobacter sp. ISL-42]MBT2751584.1 hypothetical protein [Lysobacter sp. ISL-50]MBT2775778.1 hypothetical protein [Lysobacter sp. ISL-54]MBT2782257.1 hypothetical protein [Lysobacter sp. ISL-52]